MSLWFLPALFALVAAPVVTPKEPVVREQRGITIAGVKERWRLVWQGVPKDSGECGPGDADLALTCPCSGVAYAQMGALMLERQRPNAAPERMPLAPLFAGSDLPAGGKGAVAVLARWPAPLRDIGHEPTPAVIRARPIVRIMRFSDYNHDGIAGEFLLQVDTRPCGKHVMVAVGITRDDPHLHALTSAEHPERPLALYRWQWEALAHGPRPGRVIDWPCGDHGAGEETTLTLRAERGRIHATRVTATCPDHEDASGGSHHDARFRRRVVGREIL